MSSANIALFHECTWPGWHKDQKDLRWLKMFCTCSMCCFTSSALLKKKTDNWRHTTKTRPWSLDRPDQPGLVVAAGWSHRKHQRHKVRSMAPGSTSCSSDVVSSMLDRCRQMSDSDVSNCQYGFFFVTQQTNRLTVQWSSWIQVFGAFWTQLSH